MPPVETKLSLFLLFLFSFGVLASPAGHPRQKQWICGRHMALTSGGFTSFSSPFYPHVYLPGLRCIWTASSPPETVMKMRCEPFSVTPSQNCNIDAFYFSPSGDPSFLDARYYCGNGLLELTTNGNAFAAGFYTHPYVRNYYLGFNCVLSVVGSGGGTGGNVPKPQTIPAPVQVTDPPVLSNCNCGIKGANRIVGGIETGVNEWPFTVAIRHYTTGGIFCGGTLINDRWVVTAAHCAEVVNKGDFYVSLAEHNIYQKNESLYKKDATVDTIILHESYNPNTVENDIALMRLSVPVTFNDGIRPVCLPFRYRNKNLNGKTGIALGWGQIAFEGQVSGFLQEVSLPILSADQCRKYNSTAETVTDDMICTYREGSDACKGDSGGPLVWLKNDRFYLVGITSFGKGCGDKNEPGVYTNVLKYVDWINQKVTSGSKLCSPA